MDLAEFIRRNYRLLLIAAVAGLLLALIYTKTRKPVFRAAASMEIENVNENFLNLKDISPVSTAPESYTTNDLETQIRLMESGSLIDRVLRGLPAPSDANGSERPLTHDELVAQAQRNLGVRESRQARVIDLTYDSEDPQYAAAFLNKLTQAYMEQNIESRQRMSLGTTVLLKRQLNDIRAQLEHSEKRLQDYAHSAGLLVSAVEHSPAEDQLREIQANLAKAQDNRIVQQARMETAVNSAPEALDTPAGSVIRDYNVRLTDLRRQRAELLALYTPDFDGVKRLDAQIRALETAVRNENAAELQRIQTDYADAVRQEKLLQDTYRQQIGRVSEQTESSAQYAILKREVDTNQELYSAMLQRAAEARLASVMPTNNARLVDAATAPRRPYKPNLKLNLLWGGTAGLLFGLMIGAGRERFNDRILTPGDLGAHLHVPELGTVPTIAVPMARSGRSWQRRQIESRDIALAASSKVNVPLLDALRTVATSIMLSNELGRTPQVIVVTSAKPREGKTTVTTNLAIVLAHLNRKVLLIDGNLRQPKLHQIFNNGNAFGFGDLMPTGANADLLSYVTQKTSIASLWLASSGPRESGALDVLYSQGMTALMSHARAAFDFVLIDSPSMRDLPDARVLGRIADGVILVAKSGATDQDSVKAATARLQQDGTPVLGTVLNHWNPES